MKLAITAFTARGAALAQTLSKGLTGEGHTCTLALPVRLADGLNLPGYASLDQWAGLAFSTCEGLVFVGACGIAVRAVAPYVRDKFTDPAVVALDEGGAFAVPLLSGHVGGGNQLARQVARLTGGTAVVSTATDVNGLFAVDEWAARGGFFLEDRALAKKLSAALLAGETVGIWSGFPVEGVLPRQVEEGEHGLGFAVTLDPGGAPFPETLRLIPRILHVGVGCRRGIPEEQIAAAVDEALRRFHLSPQGMKAVHTISLKAREQGLLDFCRTRGLPLIPHSAEELSGAQGEFTASEFVRGITGVDNVCERSAVLGGGTLVVKKQAGQGVTVAVAAEPFTVRFEEKGTI